MHAQIGAEALDVELQDIADYLAQLGSEDVDWMANYLAQFQSEDGEDQEKMLAQLFSDDIGHDDIFAQLFSEDDWDNMFA